MELSGWTVLESFVTSVLGGGVTAVVVWKWFGDVMLAKLVERERAKYAREIEELKAGYAQQLETHRAQLERSVFVTRAHFEVELDAYKRLFEGLGDVNLAISSTRPVVEVSPRDEPEGDKIRRLNDCLNDLIDAFNKTLVIVERLIPFYPAEVYFKLQECLNAAKGEIIDIRTGGEETFTLAWRQEGLRRLDKFTAAYHAVAEAIRD